jgi:hypothetical protein
VDVGGLTPADFARQSKPTSIAGPIVKESGFTPWIRRTAGFISRANIDEALLVSDLK